ncbi:MAG TPA: Npt1/Npt2 family nucleotide transporter [Pseudomonadota bacterium]|jgi:AAA family ATP:ADP antiporter|nr:Npt1/Npt2 family nucleotide transporter [Pseudomonadota bacterium]
MTAAKEQDGASTQTGAGPKGPLSGSNAVWFALLCALAAGAVLCGYEMLRSTASTLFVKTYGKQGLPWALGLSLIGIATLTYLYGRLLSWIGPRYTLFATTILAMATMLGCFVAIRLGLTAAVVVLFVFKESYVVLLIEQIWSYIDSKFDPAAGRTWNGPICGVAGMGAVLGGLLVGYLSRPLGTLNLLWLAAVFTVPALPVYALLFSKFGPPKGGKKKHSQTDHLGLHLFKTERVLVLLIGLIAATQVVSVLLEITFRGALADYLPGLDEQNAFSGKYYALVNFAAMFLQFVGAPLLLSLFSGRVIQLLVPLVNLLSLFSMMLWPSLTTCALAYGIYKTLDYSLFRASKELLYVPLSFDARYRAKEVIDVLGNRASKGLASLGVTALQWAGVVFSALLYGAVCLSAVAAWLGLAWALTGPQKNKQLQTQKDHKE